MTEVVSKSALVAVSGGIDSVVLLDMLVKQGWALTVAHVNHGIRPDSDDDEQFVEALARSYKLPFFTTRLRLGKNASEDVARRARYAWLETVQREQNRQVIATAHHQDDVLETMVINLERGTGWRGLSSLRSTPNRYRPLLGFSKAEIVAYALEHNLAWREDVTNDSLKYLRNRIRAAVVPRLTSLKRQQWIELYEAQVQLRTAIEAEAKQLLEDFTVGTALRRYPVCAVEHELAYELLGMWLGESLERSRLSNLLLFTKVAKKGAKWSLDERRFIVADTDRLIVLSPRD